MLSNWPRGNEITPNMPDVVIKRKQHDSCGMEQNCLNICAFCCESAPNIVEYIGVFCFFVCPEITTVHQGKEGN